MTEFPESIFSAPMLKSLADDLRNSHSAEEIRRSIYSIPVTFRRTVFAEASAWIDGTLLALAQWRGAEGYVNAAQITHSEELRLIAQHKARELSTQTAVALGTWYGQIAQMQQLLKDVTSSISTIFLIPEHVVSTASIARVFGTVDD